MKPSSWPGRAASARRPVSSMPSCAAMPREFDATKLSGRSENDSAAPRLFASRMARGALAKTLGRGKDRPIAGMEQHAAQNLCPRQHPQGRSRETARPMARGKCRIRLSSDAIGSRKTWSSIEIASAAGGDCPVSSRVGFTSRTRARCWPCANWIPQPGETILDFCAAPGGKTTYIAQLMQNSGEFVAQDTTPERLKLVEENCARLGVTCVSPVLPSTLRPSTPPFDRILLDAPCSNTGVMRRRVDLRWRIRPAEIERLRAAQLELLSRLPRG